MKNYFGNTKKTIKGIAAVVFVALVAFFSSCYAPEFLSADPLNPEMWGIGIATAGYWDKGGRFVANQTVQGTKDPVVTQMAAGMAVLSPAIGQAGSAYQFPDQFTLIADNTGGLVDVTFKYTQADDMTEARNGAIGTAWFAVQELPFGAGTIAKEDGTNIFGAMALSKSVQSYGFMTGAIQATGSSYLDTVSSIQINAFYAGLSGVTNDIWKLDPDLNNPSNFTVLKLIKDVPFTSNLSFAVTVPAGELLNLTFFNKGVVPYV